MVPKNPTTTSRTGTITLTQPSSGKTLSVSVTQSGCGIYHVSFQPTNTIVQYCSTNGSLGHCEVDLRTPSGNTVTIPNGSGMRVEGPGVYSVIAVRVYCTNGQTSDHWGATPSSFTLSEGNRAIELKLS